MVWDYRHNLARYRVHTNDIGPVCIHVRARRHFGNLTLYVHDISLSGANEKVVLRLRKALMDRFALTNMGEVRLILGMSVTTDSDKGNLTKCQEGYLRKVLKRFGMLDYNRLNTHGHGPWIRTLTIQREVGGKAVEREGHQALPGNCGVATLPRKGYTLRHLLYGPPTPMYVQ